MDGYLPNACEYDNCGKEFDSIHDLVLHIEAIHIDFQADHDEIKDYLESDDEEFPTKGIPMSLILQYGDDHEISEIKEAEEQNLDLEDIEYKYEAPIMNDEISDLPAKRPISKAYWYGPEISPQTLVQKRELKRAMKTLKIKKFACPVRGCTKSYKNHNGMKYHVMNFHDINGNSIKPAKEKKEYKCSYCGKEYKTFRGLQMHVQGHQQQQLPRGAPSAASMLQQHQGQGRPYFQESSASHSIEQKHLIQHQQYGGHTAAGNIKIKQEYNLPRHHTHTKKAYSAGVGAYSQSPSPSSSTSTSNSTPGHYRSSANYDHVPMRRNPYLEMDGFGHSQRMMVQHHQLANQGASNVLHKRVDRLSAGQESSTYDYYALQGAYGNGGYNGIAKHNGGRTAIEHGKNCLDYAAMNMQLEQLQKHMIQRQMFERHAMPSVVNYVGNGRANERYIPRRNVRQHVQNVQCYPMIPLESIKKEIVDEEDLIETKYKVAPQRRGGRYD